MPSKSKAAPHNPKKNGKAKEYWLRSNRFKICSANSSIAE